MARIKCDLYNNYSVKTLFMVTVQLTIPAECYRVSTAIDGMITLHPGPVK